MTPMRLLTTAALCCFGGAAGAAETSFVGSYTFNWLKSPAKQRCIRIDAKLQASLSSKRFRCELNSGRTGAGGFASSCRRRDDGVDYLIFPTRKACEDERKEQASNAEE